MFVPCSSFSSSASLTVVILLLHLQQKNAFFFKNPIRIIRMIHTDCRSYGLLIRMNHTDVIRIDNPYVSYGLTIRMTNTDY